MATKPERAEINGTLISCMMSAEERIRRIRRMGIDTNEIYALTRSRTETSKSSNPDPSADLSIIRCTSCLPIECSRFPQLAQDLAVSWFLYPHLSQIIKIPLMIFIIAKNCHKSKFSFFGQFLHWSARRDSEPGRLRPCCWICTSNSHVSQKSSSPTSLWDTP